MGVNESDPGRGRFQKLAVGLELEAVFMKLCSSATQAALKWILCRGLEIGRELLFLSLIQ